MVIWLDESNFCPNYELPTQTTDMFDFEQLEVYKKAKDLNKAVFKLLKDIKTIDPVLRDQLKRACISIVFNIAEGSGKFSKADKRNFYTTSRGSTYECVAIFEILFEQENISKPEFDNFLLSIRNDFKNAIRFDQ